MHKAPATERGQKKWEPVFRPAALALFNSAHSGRLTGSHSA